MTQSRLTPIPAVLFDCDFSQTPKLLVMNYDSDFKCDSNALSFFIIVITIPTPLQYFRYQPLTYTNYWTAHSRVGTQWPLQPAAATALSILRPRIAMVDT